MVIDSSPLSLSLPQQGTQSKEVGERTDRSDVVASATNPDSYARALMGPAGRAPSPNQLIQWTPVGEHDLVPEERNGEPTLRVSPDFKAKICAPWQRTLVVRLLGLRIGFVTMCNRLRGLWRPCGAMEVKDLDHDCFLVKLDNEQDYFSALTDGPWVIHDHYLVVQKWTPKFKVSDPLPKMMIVWVQLPALKIHFYHKERVEYENLPEVCFKCGKIGHQAAGCPLNSLAVPAVAVMVAGNASPELVTAESIDSNPGFGPWMMVTWKSRRNPRENLRKGKSTNEMSNHLPGFTNKTGKGGGIIKDSPQVFHSMANPNVTLQQRTYTQERKGKKGGEEVKKGKEKVVVESSGQGVGLLGPGPSRLNPTSKCPIRPKENSNDKPSTSVASLQPKMTKSEWNGDADCGAPTGFPERLR
ncbi:unnamed protein product [Linum tenue]|uniref:CCHC-type domain-containing protein n=1 Tax=Linum tenue TaxID=586396 RepID=A0AAV0J3H2_9ROSI|nr:unnamed protein product [Linum tenue]